MHKGMVGRQGEEGPGSVSPLGTTLNDYIQKALIQETSPKKKISFEEWWLDFEHDSSTMKEDFHKAWKAGQENL